MTQDNRTFGERVSDYFAKLVRSWEFIIFQVIFIFLWTYINGFHIVHFDPWPFDGLKLILLIETSFMGSMILMNQHRQSRLDRKLSYHDFFVNLEAKKEVDQILPLIKDEHRKMVEVLDILKKDKPPVDKSNE